MKKIPLLNGGRGSYCRTVLLGSLRSFLQRRLGTHPDKNSAGSRTRRMEMTGRKLFVSTLILCVGVFLCAPALATVIIYDVTNSPDSYDFTGGPAAKIRDGYVDTGGYWTNMEIIGYVPLDVKANQKGKATYGGGWPVATDIPFTFSYTRSSGTISLQMVLAPDDKPYIASKFKEFKNYGFRGIRVNLGGTTDEVVTVKNFTVNGQLIGSGTATSATDIYYYLANSDLSPFTDLTITGLINFSDLAVDGSAEFARFEIALGYPVHTPIPASALLLGSGLFGLGLLGWRRRS